MLFQAVLSGDCQVGKRVGLESTELRVIFIWTLALQLINCVASSKFSNLLEPHFPYS